MTVSSQTHPVIGMILKGYPRFSETFIANEIRLLEELGFSVVIIAMRNPNESQINDSVGRIKAPVIYLPSRIFGNITRLGWACFNVALRSPRAFGRAVRMAGQKLRKSRSSATIKHLLQAVALVHYVPSVYGITRLHAHSASSPASVAQFAHALTGLAFGFTGHAKDIYAQRRQALRDKTDQADLVVTCTRYNQEYLTTLCNGSRQVHCVYHGTDISMFPFRGVKHPPKMSYTIFCVARFVVKKGLLTILQALAILREQGVNFTFRHIGDNGPQEATVRQEAEALGVSDFVEWLGPSRHDDIPPEYSKADAFVLACQKAPDGDQDGIPNVLAESMAVGVPVVATKLSGISELVTDNETGLLVPPNDPAALADALRRVLTDIPLRERIIPAARQRVEDMFDNEVCIHKLAQVYDEA